MALVTVVEAAGLSGLRPDAIRHLVESGRLRALAVPLEPGPAYLIESAQLDCLGAGAPSGPEPGTGRTVPSSATPLAEALAGLRAALARRRLEREALDEAACAERPPPPPGRPRRNATGLGELELGRLAARVERLLAV